MRRALALALVLLLTTACGEEVEVRVSSRLFPDLGLQRTVRVDARAPGREEPYPPDWLRTAARLALAAPESWDRVEEHATGLRAEGFFAPGEKVPPILAHGDSEEERPDRAHLRVERDDLVVLDRFTFEESLGGPFGPKEMAEALDALLDALALALSADLRRQFGEEIATRRIESFLRKDARAFLLELLTAFRETDTRPSLRAGRLAEVRARHRLPPVEDPGDFLDQDLHALIERAAAELVRSNPQLPAAELRAFVAGEEGAIARLLEDPAFGPEVDARALLGSYGSGAEIRYVTRVEVPGRILRTNGTVDGQAAVFTFDQDALAAADLVLQVESVELDDEALRRLGARRDLDVPALLRAVHLLTREDLAEPLRGALREAVERGSFAPLRESSEQAARELADLLDPEATWPPS